MRLSPGTHTGTTGEDKPFFLPPLKLLTWSSQCLPYRESPPKNGAKTGAVKPRVGRRKGRHLMCFKPLDPTVLSPLESSDTQANKYLSMLMPV